MMFIGGASGSTAGGIKVNRVMLAYAGVKWWLKRYFASSRILVPLRFEGRTIPRHISDLEISKNMVVIMLYSLTVFLVRLLSCTSTLHPLGSIRLSLRKCRH